MRRSFSFASWFAVAALIGLSGCDRGSDELVVYSSRNEQLIKPLFDRYTQETGQAIRFVTEVLGFEELVLARSPEGAIVHSEYRWPEGGIVQIAGADPANPFLTEPGRNAGLYVITRDPQAVWERCQRAGGEVLRPPEEPHYDPGGMGFAVRDPEGNAWSFGSYAGGATG